MENTLLQGDGIYNVNTDWPYPYNNYTGFITGNINKNAYRQRNIFLCPPETPDRCAEIETINAGAGDANKLNLVQGPGGGTCSDNRNSLIFEADQSGCSKDGSIAGEFTVDFGAFNLLVDTTTELIGADNALLYKVFGEIPAFSVPRSLSQSQLTTLVDPPPNMAN